MIVIDFDADLAGPNPLLRRAALIRTARRIFEGQVCIPEQVWPGRVAGTTKLATTTA